MGKFNTMKKLLIPVDFSVTSEAAVDFGLQLASAFGYEVMLHHALSMVKDDERYYRDSDDRLQQDVLDEKLTEKMEAKMDKLLQQWDVQGLTISNHLTKGALLDDLKELVKAHNVDLVVMGTRGATGLKELFVGSNTEKIVRHMHCPVIAVHSSVRVANVKRILVPVDLDHFTPSFLMEIADLQRLFRADVEFTWVKNPTHAESLELLVEEFENVLKTYEVKGTFSIINDAIPHAGILTYADEIEADMIAMATHHRSGVAHLFLGSVTENVLNHTHLPLWTFSLNQAEEPIHLENFRKGSVVFV
jgi:nucleotide-binding universal stress UspA family protein